MNAEPPRNENFSCQTRPMPFPNNGSAEEFNISEEDKELTLAQVNPFSHIPKLTDKMYDLHTDKTFLVKDFRVTWEHGMNDLVSPYYPESGGTVIDWWDENGDKVFDEFDDDSGDDFEYDAIDEDLHFYQVCSKAIYLEGYYV